MSWKSISSCAMYSFMISDTSLSNFCSVGLNPRDVSSSTMLLYAVHNEFFVLLEIACACIKLLSYLYRMKMYLLPEVDGQTNLPV